jgi:hypothetical protein
MLGRDNRRKLPRRRYERYEEMPEPSEEHYRMAST